MTVIESVFKQKKPYIAYLTCGDGGAEMTLQAMAALVQGGVDIIEVGVPFSDPVADGPVIQAAAMRALEAGITMDDVLAMIKRFKQTQHTPIILFSYYNPILQQGNMLRFMQRAKDVGVDGCLIVDLPIEESDCYRKACIAADIAPIFLLSPSTPMDRVEAIARYGTGMLYYACRKGVTGVQSALPVDLNQKLQAIKKITSLPVVVGFGIGDRQSAQAVIAHADGFVVGSRFVEAIAQGVSGEALTALARSIDPRKVT